VSSGGKEFSALGEVSPRSEKKNCRAAYRQHPGPVIFTKGRRTKILPGDGGIGREKESFLESAAPAKPPGIHQGSGQLQEDERGVNGEGECGVPTAMQALRARSKKRKRRSELQKEKHLAQGRANPRTGAVSAVYVQGERGGGGVGWINTGSDLEN